MLGIGHNETEKNDYSNLYKLLKDNPVILAQINSRNNLKEIVIGAALLHFSTLPTKKQLKTVTKYLDIGFK